MEYRIELSGAQPREDALVALLEREDEAAIVDFDARAGVWRISTNLGADELAGLFACAGCRVLPGQLRALPSVCCGGCSG